MKCSYGHSLFEMYALFFPLFFCINGKKIKIKILDKFYSGEQPTPQALPSTQDVIIIVVVFGLFQNFWNFKISLPYHSTKVLNNNKILVIYVRKLYIYIYIYILQLDIILNDEDIGLENFNSNFWHGKHIFFRNFGNSKNK